MTIFAVRLISLLLLNTCLLACGGGSANTSITATTPQTATEPSSNATDVTTLNNVSYADVEKLTFQSHNLRIQYGDGPLQFADYWSPVNTQKDELSPLFIMIHGGCWSNSYRLEQTYPMASAINKQTGFAVLSIEYRASGDTGGGWPGTLQDILLALHSLDQMGLDQIDLDNVILAGHSAGGHLALLAASESITPLKHIIGLAAIVDIQKYSEGSASCNQAAATFLGGNYADIPDIYHAANPTSKTLPNSISLLFGSLDNIVPISHAQASGLDFTSIDDAGHFDWLHPDTTAFRHLIDLINQISNDKSP